MDHLEPTDPTQFRSRSQDAGFDGSFGSATTVVFYEPLHRTLIVMWKSAIRVRESDGGAPCHDGAISPEFEHRW